MTKAITAKELRKLVEDDASLKLVDVRSAAEYASGHVPGAVNIPMELLESQLADVPQNVVLICQGGTRATVCAGWIDGKRTASILQGGTRAWQQAGYPIVASTPCRWALERQVRLGAGLMVLAGTLLSLFVDKDWIFLAMFAGAGLTFAGITNICGMGLLLARMPWNRDSKVGNPGPVNAPNCCS